MRISVRSLVLVVASFSVLASADEPPKPQDTTLGQGPPEGATVLFADPGDLAQWVQTDGTSPVTWKVNDGSLIAGGGDIRSKESFGCFRLHLEFQVPALPNDPARGNSGVYLQGRYEIQILDSFGVEHPDRHDCGAAYNQHAPLVNACQPPGVWQTFDITFHCPQVEEGRVVEKPRVTVVQNGLTIIDDQEIAPTPSGLDSDSTRTTGPILLQDHGSPVRFRNIWVESLD